MLTRRLHPHAVLLGTCVNHGAGMFTYMTRSFLRQTLVNIPESTSAVFFFKSEFAGAKACRFVGQIYLFFFYICVCNQL